MQRRRNGERRQRARQLVAIAGIREQPGFQHRLGQLFDEQRHAVGARHDLLDDFGRQRLVARDPRHQIGALAPTEAAHSQRSHVCLSGPGRLELRPEGDQDQDRQLPDALDHEAQELQRRRVDPVHVLVHSQHRPLRRQARDLVDQRLQRPPLLHLRRQGERRIALTGRHPEQSGDQWNDLVQRSPERPSIASSLASCVLRRLVAIEPRRPLQQTDHRIQRTVGVMRRAVVAERRCAARRPGARARSAACATCRSPARPRGAPPGRRRPWPSAQRSSKMPSSCSRPTSGVRCSPCRASKRPSARPSPSTRQTASGSAKPLRRRGPRSASSNSPPTSRRVAWLITHAARRGERLQACRQIWRLADHGLAPAPRPRQSARRP